MIEKIENLVKGTHRYFRSIASKKPDVFSKCMCAKVKGEDTRCRCKAKSRRRCVC
jgi:hypothetical protein